MHKLAITLVAAMSFAAAAKAEDKVTFQYSWIPTGEYAPFSAGMALGFFKEAGIDLAVVTGRGSGDAVKRVAGGAAMIGDGDISAVMAARVNEKAPIKCFMAQHTISPHSLFVLESSKITSFKELAGKTLVTTPGNSHFIYFPLVAKMAGLDPASVKWVTGDAAAMAPMLIAKKVDGAPLFATHEYYQNKQAKTQGETIKVIPYADYGFKIYSYCWYATEEAMKANPDVIRRFAAATQRSFLWAKDHAEEAAELHHKRHPEVDTDDALGSMRIMNKYMYNEGSERDGLGHFNAKQLADTYKVVAESQNLDKSVDPAVFVDESFLPSKKVN